MTGYICDNCGVAKRPAECDMWLMLGFLPVSDGLLAIFESEEQRARRQERTDRRESSPLSDAKHFCSVECCRSFLVNDLRGVLEAIQ